MGYLCLAQLRMDRKKFVCVGNHRRNAASGKSSLDSPIDVLTSHSLLSSHLSEIIVIHLMII